MALTPRGYPYSALSDAPDGPDQIAALAQAVDTDVTALQTLLTQSSVIARRNDATVVNGVDVSPTHVVTYDVSVAVLGSDITFSGGVATINRAAHYAVGSSVQWPVGSGIVAIEFFVNGGGSQYGRTAVAQSGSHTMPQTAYDVLPLGVGDTVQLGLQSLDGVVNNVLVRSFTIHRVAF